MDSGDKIVATIVVCITVVLLGYIIVLRKNTVDYIQGGYTQVVLPGYGNPVWVKP